jgi:L-cysteine desulfidase
MISEQAALKIIEKTVFRTVGCTEPVAVALAAASAYRRIGGEIRSVAITLDRNVYKNALNVGIPGTDRKGIRFAVALALVCGDPEEGLSLLEKSGPADLERAESLYQRKLITLSLNEEALDVYINVTVTTGLGKATALIRGCHDNIILIKKNEEVVHRREEARAGSAAEALPSLAGLTTADLLSLVERLPEESLAFLSEGVTVNLAAAEAGLAAASGLRLGAALDALRREGLLADSFLNRLKIAASAASDARMGGLKVPIIGAGGSGNHGITFFITVGLAYRNLPVLPSVSLTRALALGILVLADIKEQTGLLTPICGCAVAAGVAAAAAITYALAGPRPQPILAAVNLLLGNLAGEVCDGAKYGCSLKINTCAGAAVESALLAVRGVEIPASDGIVGTSLPESLGNLALLHKRGMEHVDETILEILFGKSI